MKHQPNPSRRIVAGTLLLVSMALLGGCGGGSSSTASGRAGACDATPTHSDGRARWTVLVYMNAANNLQPDSLTNIAQMASVGSDTNVNIVVQWKQAGCANCGTPSFLGTRRYFLHTHSVADIARIRSGDTSVLDRDHLSANDPLPNTSGFVDMGDWRTLQAFARWGAANYPADNLALVIWDHGSGWVNVLRSAHKRISRAVSQDSETSNEIETQELPQALSGTYPDLLIFDASLEQMAEVAYEVRNNARVMVGSEESPPGSGYPYDAWLTGLKAGGSNPCTTAQSIIQTFLTAYPVAGNITQSALDLSRMDGVAAAINRFGRILLLHEGDQADVIAAARGAAQHYAEAYSDNKDLYDFADRIRTTSTRADLVQAAADLQTTLVSPTGGAILQNGHGTAGQNGSNGLAIYIPAPSAYLPQYGQLALSRSAPYWPAFLKTQLK